LLHQQFSIYLLTQLVVTVLIGLFAAVIDGVRYIKAAV
jgi:hypothetical protein